MTNNNLGNITALYARLSQEDALDGERNSIANQKKSFLSTIQTAFAPTQAFSTTTVFSEAISHERL